MFDELVIFDTPALHQDGNPWCHLAAKDEQALHQFAIGIGMKTQWFKPSRKDGLPHYDIKSDQVRSRAIKAGAVQVSRKYLYQYLLYHFKKTSNMTDSTGMLETIAAFDGWNSVKIGFFGIHLGEDAETKWQKVNERWLEDMDRNLNIGAVGKYFVKVKQDKRFSYAELNNKMSYDFLIPIVEKIEKMDYGFKMCRKKVEFYRDSTKEVILEVKKGSRIESLFYCLHDAILWLKDNDHTITTLGK